VRVVQTLLFVTGINTLLQTLIGTRLPTVIGGSFAFVVPILSIIKDPSLANIPNDAQVSSLSLSLLHACTHSQKIVFLKFE
jgi:xanthine/uracil permease